MEDICSKCGRNFSEETCFAAMGLLYCSEECAKSRHHNRHIEEVACVDIGLEVKDAEG